MDYDRFGKHDQIGEVKINMAMIDLAQPLEEWRDIQSVEEASKAVSYLMCSFDFLLSSSKLLTIRDHLVLEKCPLLRE